MEKTNFQKILIIQTAFLGDVILATAILEKLHIQFPAAQLSLLVKKGNESLFKNHPFISRVWAWDKKHKLKSGWRILTQIRKERFDLVVNLHRFASSGLFTLFSKSKITVGFSKNPFSRWFTYKYPHEIGIKHEIERNQVLIESFTDSIPEKPKLYPSSEDNEFIKKYTTQSYLCIAPNSIWFTKQFPLSKWIEFINKIPSSFSIYLLGSADDYHLNEEIKKGSTHSPIENLAGKLNILQSAALMKNAFMNYVNDSAPLHIASAMNAPVCAIYCSTVPSFGFGPLSDKKYIVETKEILTCRPCGLHGHAQCPEGHFLCALTILIEDLLIPLKNN